MGELWDITPEWAHRLYGVAFFLLVVAAVLEAKLARWRPKTPFFVLELALAAWGFIWWRQS